MIGLSHVVLHLTLCKAADRLPQTAAIPIRLHLNYGPRVQIDKSFTVERGTSAEHNIEFDMPKGIYRAQLTAPTIDCGAVDYWPFIDGADRAITLSLNDGGSVDLHPVVFFGTAPPSFLYLNPTYVLFDKNTACNTQVGDPLQGNIRVEEDQTSFYIYLYPSAAIEAQGSVVVALQVATPTGDYHYVRLRVPFPQQWTGWPYTYQLNVTDNIIDGLSGQPTGTLLCPVITTTMGG